MQEEGSVFERLKIHLMLNGDGQGLELLQRYKRQRDDDVEDAIGLAIQERNKRFLCEQDMLHIENGANLLYYAQSISAQNIQKEEEEEEQE